MYGNVSAGIRVCLENRGWAQCGLFTGKVVFEGCEQVSDDGHAPGPAQQLLPGAAAHVGHVRVVDGEPEDPEGGSKTQSSSTTQGSSTTQSSGTTQGPR